MGCFLDYTLMYDGLKIVNSGSELTIYTTNFNYRTDWEIKVGDAISKAEKMCDRKLGFRSEKRRGFITYREKVKRYAEMSLALEIDHKNGRVTHIKYERNVHEDC